MNKKYSDTVYLLLTSAPDVFKSDLFAMKGGTAINLFIRDMPRLSVDIDLVYKKWNTPRKQALDDITSELGAISKRLEKLGLRIRKISNRDIGDSKLIIENENAQIKIEVNGIFRGTVLPTEIRTLSPKTAEMFSMQLALPTLTADELYGSKLVAAMDRQHPRDLFDVWQLFECGGLSDAAIECFVTYLAGHNRPIHEVLFGNNKDITSEYENNFFGMTLDPISLETLLETRLRLRLELPQRLTNSHREFLLSLARAEPEWKLLKCPHAAELPALQWKLANLKIFSQRRPDEFKKQFQTLKNLLFS
jgi:predicted nucleotidyltransferase component of viral defense system